MANTIPLTFRSAPFPEGYEADPETFKNDLVARLYAESGESISFFASGSVAPSSNVGPWFKNEEEWYRWDNGTGQYVPIVVNQESLRYIASQTAPDQTKYTFWIELNADGKAIDIKYYSGGAWKSIFEDKFAQYSTTTQMNTAISSAISGIPASVVGQGLFKARMATQQDIVFAAPDTQTGTVSLGTVVSNPDGYFSGNNFTAAATGFYQFNATVEGQVTAGTPTVVELVAQFAVNATDTDSLNDLSDTAGNGSRVLSGATMLPLSAGDVVNLSYYVSVNAASTFSITTSRTSFSGYRVR